jgi:Lipoprotein LpqB beta-propeller domain/Sporulation and spore germination
MITSRAGRLAAAGLAWWARAGTRGRAAAAAFAVAVAVGGCSTVPTSGPVQQVGAGQLGISQDYSQPIPVGPGPDWTATEIVSGFLAASASFANDHQVAREYLDGTAQRKWQPGWAVTVVSRPPTTSTAPPSLRQPLAGPQQARVKVTGLPVATLTDTGQYLVSSASSSQSYYYNLTKVDGQWRIDTLPRTQLLLTQADFQRVYQPRDLYFLTPSGKTLVPDPVFVPQQATNTELATGLVTALLTDRDKGWLSGAVLSGFPANAQLIDDPVTINGSNVIVDLAEKHAVSDRRQLDQMAAQLAWTLGNGPTTAIQSVELEINGHPVQIMGGQSALPQDFGGWVPTQPDGSSFYFIGSHGSVEELSGVGQPGSGRVAVVPGAAGTAGVPPFSSIAVSPNRRWVAGISAGGGAVYYGSLSPGVRLREWRPTSGTCTSVSWDDQGDLWIAAGGEVWVLPAGSTSAPLVTLDGVPPQDEVTQFRVAPDGVRAAMIVRGTFDNQPGSQVLLAAITRSGGSSSVGPPVTIGSGIPDPEAVSWFGTDDVIVLSGSSSGAQLHEVPLNGAQPTAIAVTGGVPVSLTATDPGDSTAEIVLGMSDGKIMISANLGTFEPARTLGAAPVFPG